MTPDITADAVMTALRAYLLDVLGTGWEVVQGQPNRVPEPTSSNYVIMTESGRSRLATNVDDWDRTDPSPTALSHMRSTEATIQLDVHGDMGADAALVIATLWRDDYGVQQMAPIASPLWATDGQQMPFINGEKQYEQRWMMTLHMQINPIVSTPQEFADTVIATILPPVEVS